MEIPASCVTWGGMMNAGEREQRVLRNVERDACVPADTVTAFFDQLAGKGPFHDAAAAWAAAKAVVNDDPDMFYCTGLPVGSLAFALALRFAVVEDWVYLVPLSRPDVLEGLRQRFPIAGANWPQGLTENQRRSFCLELAQVLQVGFPNRIAWVSDAGQVPWDAPGLRQVLRCLGLPQFEGIAWTFVLRYNRVDLPRTMHVPRAFDGIGNWPFRVEEDCSAPSGTTRPTKEAGADATGYPEAVHRSTEVPVRAVELKAIDNDPAAAS